MNITDPTPEIRTSQSPTQGAGFDEDDGIRVVVERRLQNSSYWSLRRVRCFVANGVVTLFGAVPSYHVKQVAQTLVAGADRVVRIENHCEVVSRRNNGSMPHQPQE